MPSHEESQGPFQRVLSVACIAAPTLAGLCCASSAQAWSYESVVSEGCHERITAEALRRARAELDLAPIEPTEEERLLIRELPFHVERDMRDVAGASLLVGVRHNDLKGHGPRDIDRLAFVHGNPESQDEHCLRRDDQDGSGGNEAALRDCREFIRNSAMRAVVGGVSEGNYLPDPNARTGVEIHLAFAGESSARLPIAYLYLGHALHTLQDSFTHTYRTPDGSRVTAVLNWIDFVEHEHDERRDGPAHSSALDQCSGMDEFRQERYDQAVEASTELLRAALNPAVPPAERGDDIDAVLDRWLGHEAACSMDDRWCDAPERQYVMEHGCTVAAPGARRDGASPLWLLLAPVMLAAARWRGTRYAAAAVGALIALSFASSVQAQEKPSSALRTALPVALEDRVAEDEDADDAEDLERPFALHVAVGGGIDHAAVAVSVGVRYRFAEAWMIGLDAELNPWASVDSQRFEWGTFQSYATVVRSYDVSPTVSLRTTGQLGVSTLLFDVYGVDDRSLGLYVGLSLVGIEIAMDDSLALVVDPAHVAVPVPQLTGAPCAYRQYRFTSALQWTI